MANRKIINQNRDFKGVWIPAEYWLDSNLSVTEMLFITEISSLDINGKGCYASNRHFANFFGFTTVRASQVIGSLTQKKYISTNYDRTDTGQVKKRILRVLNKLNTPTKNILKGYKENLRGTKNTLKGYKENAKESNTFNNTVSNTSSNCSSTSLLNKFNTPNSEQPAATDNSDIFTFYQKNGFGQLAPLIAEDINYWVDDFIQAGSSPTETNAIIIKALTIAVERGRVNWSYVKGILKDWDKHNLRTVTAIEAEQAKFEQQTKSKQTNNFSNSNQGVASTAKRNNYKLPF